MDLNNVVFSKEQVTDLFGKQLVAAIGYATNMPDVNDEMGIKFKGKNKKNIVWLIEIDDHLFLNDADFQFLTKVIEACRLNLDDIALINMNDAANQFKLIINQLNPVLLLASGISANKISFKTQLYTIEQTNGFTLFITNSIEDMRKDAVKKSKLWVGLKQILSIN